jgi:hypothetical protein
MSVPTLGKWLFGIQSAAFVYVCLVLPFRYVLRSGRFWRGVLFVWVTTAAFVFCSVLFGQFLRLNVDKSLEITVLRGHNFCCLRSLDGGRASWFRPLPFLFTRFESV